VEGREREWLVGISQHGNVSKAYYDRTFRKRKKRKQDEVAGSRQQAPITFSLSLSLSLSLSPPSSSLY
jgi:hypothetical protein